MQRPGTRSTLLATLAVGAAVLLGTSVPRVAAAEPLPACRYDDVLTRYREYKYWRRTLLDPIYKVPSTYAPPNRVDTSAAGLNAGYSVRSLVISDLKAMASAARAAGARFSVQSAYRSYARQAAVFKAEVEKYGYQTALKQSARPGHSEHQLGTTLDFRSYGNFTPPWDYADWGTTKAGAWLRVNSWKYGFLMSYPKGKQSVTCYVYEPWHFRYVGRYQAKLVRDSGLTLRQWLWRYRR